MLGVATDAAGRLDVFRVRLRLAEDGIFVTFAPEAIVLSEMPSSLRQAKSQNLRWEKGRFQMAWQRGPRLLVDAVRQRSWKPIDIFIEQATPPLSVLGSVSMAMVPVMWLTGNTAAVVLALCTVGALGVHVLAGLVSAKVPRGTYRAFVFAPVFVAWKLLVYVLALLPGAPRWVRTERR
jgi:1,2-diacylglycerol 3-beta-glucosyltransferase